MPNQAYASDSPDEPPDNTRACATPAEAIALLEFVLTESGGDLLEEYEPGLPPNTRAVEAALRQAIRFLETLH